ncbi:MAG: tRNA (N(6)-L-threonylcarbamoyladenosine(37)-C(2))-methylthiotransferase MtaB [Thermodesulfobacteriota bacterium]|nr:MAG: tRNA (N(6)-L-threonylcarbamoyladenosine(37)-C(2))-methylthiotransferase MtaB [Thermodesulfobacteriota bacterium]
MKSVNGPVLSVSVTTLGCKANQYDSSAMEEALSAEGLSTVAFPGPADAYVINTCTVTARTDSQSRQLIRRAQRANPRAVVIVTGCYAQVFPGDVEGIKGVDYILGNPQKQDIFNYIKKGRNPDADAKVVVGPEAQGALMGLRARGASGRTRTNLKIQDGCNKKCSYCIIPRARGLSRSLTLEEVEREIDLLVERGFKEVVFTGIHIGSYGHDLTPARDLKDVMMLVEKRDWPARFRISSLDPDEVDMEFIDILKTSKKICNHLHLPLQSGDDSIIKKMQRPYSAKDFYEKAVKLAAEVKDISIGTDVIAGFPGEREPEFEKTFSLLEETPLSYLHVFPFSPRTSTPAYGYEGRVDPKTVKERCRRLRGLDTLKRRKYLNAFIGKEAEVLVEGSQDKKTGLLRGKSRNYIPVVVQGGQGLENRILRVALKGLDGQKGMWGCLLDNTET